jgi:hypothetical protein
MVIMLIAVEQRRERMDGQEGAPKSVVRQKSPRTVPALGISSALVHDR